MNTQRQLFVFHYIEKIGFVLFGLSFFLSLGFFVIVIFVWVCIGLYMLIGIVYILSVFIFGGFVLFGGVRDILNARAIYLQIEEAWA